jgi:peptide chain release factor 2
VLKERTSLQKIVETWEDAAQELEDLQILAELGEEGEDESTLEEIRSLLPDLEKKVERMEFARMLSGEHVASNAIFSLIAGAGGTEAQDWAEMLRRMSRRFCERQGF